MGTCSVLSLGMGFPGSLLEDPVLGGFLALCLRAWVYVNTTCHGTLTAVELQMALLDMNHCRKRLFVCELLYFTM